MPGPVPHPDDPPRTVGRTGPPCPLRSASSGTSTTPPGAPDRLAELAADGAVELLSGGSEEEPEQLVRSARQRLQHQILQYIARQVALDLWRPAQSRE